MQKKLLILAVLALILIGGAVFVWEKKNSQVVSQNSELVQENTQDGNQNEVFVTDVDPDVSHWQVKETEFFTIKFPKEWYWVEYPGYDDQGSGGSFVISNNPSFPLKEYSDLGIFPSRSYELVLKNNTEIVIDFDIYDYGPHTSSFGNPQDPSSDLNNILHLVPKINTTAKCEFLSGGTSAVSAYCSIRQENHQKDIVYYKASRMFSLMLTLKTTDSLSINPGVLTDIAESFVLRY